MIPHSCQYRNKMLNWGLSIWFLKLNKLYSSDQERKKNLEKKHVYFFIKASQLVIDSSHLNEHPSSTTTQKKIKPPCMLSRFSEVIIKRKTFIKKVLTPPKNKKKTECTARVPAHLQCQNTRFSDWMWRFLFIWQLIDMNESVCQPRQTPRENSPSPPQISQYVKSAVGRLHNYIHACVLGLNNINISDCCRRPRM